MTTVTRCWLVVLYALAGGCGSIAAGWAFIEIGQAAKKARALRSIPGDAFYQQVETGFGTRPSDYQMRQVPEILLHLLGKRRQRVIIGTLVLVGILAGTAADILAATQ